MVSAYLRSLAAAVPACTLVFSLGVAQAQQADSAVTLFNNVRVFDGKGASLSEPTNVLVRGNLIERISTEPIPVDRMATTTMSTAADGR